jgi:parallel beta-helix repeat protein
MNCECEYNIILRNSFRFGGDGVFMSGFPRQGKNECCPSNSNYLAYNDCSYSPNNAFESTFARNNTFVHNTVTGSNYGFWLGYSYSNKVVNNSIGSCVTAGIAIEHGQHNLVEGNSFVNNTIGVWMWTDLKIHFPATKYSCLALPDPQHSRNATIASNRFWGNKNYSLIFQNTTESNIYNNIFNGTCADVGFNKLNTYNLAPKAGPNIIGGQFVGGNYWTQYKGKGRNGFGDTPYQQGTMSVPDNLPLIPQ